VRCGRYEVVSEIGRGGSGVVYRGRSPEGAPVAIKMLLRPGARDALPRFERERRLLALLGESDGFVPLLDVGEVPQGPFLVMPFVGGGTLRARIDRGALSIDDTVALGRALARTIGEAHARGLVHRDLKPENVLFHEDGRPLVADLGLAKHFRVDAPGGSDSVSLSRSQELRGTVGYAAPEQLADAKEAGPAADVFALGAILFECATGKRAFPGETPLDVLAAVTSGNHEPLREALPGVPPWLDRVVERALEAKPERRYADGAALARALEGESPAPPVRSRARIAALVALLLAGAAIGPAIGFAILGKHEPAPSPPPPPPPVEDRRALPPQCRGFAETARARLTRVLFAYDWKAAGSVRSVAFLADGKRAVSGGFDRTVRLWNTETGAELAVLGVHETAVVAVAAADLGGGAGDRIVAASTDGTLEVHDGPGFSRRRTLGTKLRSLASVSLFARGTRAFVTGNDEGPRVFDLDAATEIDPTPALPRGRPFVLAPREKHALSADATATYLWNLETQGPVTLFGEGSTALAFLPDGNRAVFGNERGTLTLWDFRGGTTGFVGGAAVGTLQAHAGSVTALAVSPDGTTVATASVDGAVKLWEIGAHGVVERPTHTLTGPRGEVDALAFSPDGKRLLSGNDDSTLALWDRESGRLLSPIAGPRRGARTVAPLPSGAQVLVGDGWGDLTLVDRASGRVVRTFASEKAGVQAVAVSPDGKRALVSDRGPEARLLDLGPSAELLPPLVGRGQNVSAFAFAPDGKRALVADLEGQVDLWDLGDTRRGPRAELAGHPAGVWGVTFSRDGKRALTAGQDHVLRVFDTPDGAYGALAGRALTGHQNLVVGAFFLADGKHALSASTDGVMLLWDMDAGTFEAKSTGGSSLHTLALSPDTRLALTARESVLTLWDTATFREVDRIDLATSSDFPVDAAFAADGKSFLVATARGVVLDFGVR
jgi:WD40 repeat protein